MWAVPLMPGGFHRGFVVCACVSRHHRHGNMGWGGCVKLIRTTRAIRKITGHGTSALLRQAPPGSASCVRSVSSVGRSPLHDEWLGWVPCGRHQQLVDWGGCFCCLLAVCVSLWGQACMGCLCVGVSRIVLSAATTPYPLGRPEPEPEPRPSKTIVTETEAWLAANARSTACGPCRPIYYSSLTKYKQPETCSLHCGQHNLCPSLGWRQHFCLYYRSTAPL